MTIHCLGFNFSMGLTFCYFSSIFGVYVKTETLSASETRYT
jgi:hypothetical protein